MLKKYIQHQQIIDLLNINYGIEVRSVHPVLSGADANAATFKAESATNSFFVKLKWNHQEEIHLAILQLLHDAGIKEIIFPLQTLDGKLFYASGDFNVLVYPFIDAPNGFTQSLTEAQWNLLGKTLRKIHEISVPVSIQKQIRKEIYPAKWRETVRHFFTKMHLDLSDDSLTCEFKIFFQHHLEVIRELVDSAEMLSKKIQPNVESYVLCHSDIHAGNVLLPDENSIYIVDWDHPMMAPKERDLMFIGAGVGNVWNKSLEIPCFYEGYGRTNIDNTLLFFYRQERILEDIVEFGNDLLSNIKADQERLEMFNHFKAMFYPNGVVQIAMNINDRQ